MQANGLTHTFRLTSGPECEVRKLSGLQQRILTEQKQQTFNEKLFQMLLTIIVRIGNIYMDALSEKEQKDLVTNLLSSDRKQILVEARMSSYPDDPEFVFTFKYKDRNKVDQEVVKEVPLTSEGFPIHKVKVFDPTLVDGVRSLKAMRKIRDIAQDAAFDNYEDVIANSILTGKLPASGKKIVLSMRNGKSDAAVAGVKKENRSSHTALLMANPRWVDEATNTPITYQAADLDKMDTADLEYMRMLLKSFEGQIDTELMFEHPEAEVLPPDEREVVTDLLGELSFFFPSEAI